MTSQHISDRKTTTEKFRLNVAGKCTLSPRLNVTFHKQNANFDSPRNSDVPGKKGLWISNEMTKIRRNP